MYRGSRIPLKNDKNEQDFHVHLLGYRATYSTKCESKKNFLGECRVHELQKTHNVLLSSKRRWNKRKDVMKNSLTSKTICNQTKSLKICNEILGHGKNFWI